MPAKDFHSRFFSTIDRYVLKQFGVSVLGILMILWLIYIATRFARYLAQAAVGGLPSEAILTLLGYSSIGALSLLLPLAAFLAMIMVLGRMRADSELVVLSACGMGTGQRIKQVLMFSTVIALLVALLLIWVMPTVLADRKMVERQSKAIAETSGMTAGTFKESRNGEWVFYAEEITRGTPRVMRDIFIKIKHQPPLVLRAETGYFHVDPETEDRYLVLENGYRYEGTAGETQFRNASFAQHQVLLQKGGSMQARKRFRSMKTRELWEKGTPETVAELQWRASSVIMVLILGLLTVPLTQLAPRKGRYAGLFTAILLYITYSNLLGVTRAWVSSETIPYWLGAVWVHGFMLCLFYVLFKWPQWRLVAARRKV